MGLNPKSKGTFFSLNIKTENLYVKDIRTEALFCRRDEKVHKDKDQKYQGYLPEVLSFSIQAAPLVSLISR